jgi:hypothetical protein
VCLLALTYVLHHVSVARQVSLIADPQHEGIHWDDSSITFHQNIEEDGYYLDRVLEIMQRIC